MSGIVFPNLVGTLAPLMQMDQAAEQNQFLQEDRKAKAEIAPLIPKALQGDKEALNQIGARHPDTFTKLMPMLQSIDANQRAKVKETSEWTTRAAMGVLSLPENERPAAYQAALADGQRLGYKIDMPPQYDRAVEGRLRQLVNQTRTFENFWKNQDENVQAMPPLDNGGIAPPSAGGVSGDVLGRTKQAIGGMESGNRYDAVGPDTGSGKRALGKYQVMDVNVGPWTQEALGRSLTPQQFLASPEAQEAVADFKLGQYIKQFGSPEAAARAWFAGAGGMNNPGAKDVLGTSVQGYGQKFAQAFGPGATGSAQPPGLAQGDAAPRADASGNPLPPPQQNAREILTVRQFVHSQIPGASPLTVNGFPAYDKNGRLGIQLPNGQRDFIDVPKPKEPKERQIPPGYEENPNGGLRPIVGGPADPKTAQSLADAKRKADEKTIPQSVTKGVQENLDNLKEVDRALGMLTKTPNSVGGPGSIIAANIPGAGLVQNWIDKEGTDVRAKIANIGSLIVHQRSGAAVTASEFPRLKPFIPTISDDPPTVKKKLEQFKQVYEEVIRDTLEYYGPENGFRPYTPATNYINRDQTQAPAANVPPPAAPAPMPAPTPPQPAKQGSADRGKVLFDARDAILKGADPAKVRERLKAMGIEDEP